MKALKKPSVAIVIAAVIIIASTLFSVRLKLGNEFQDVRNGFYDGLTFDGYKHPSVSEQLLDICGAVDGMAALADGYGIDCEELKDNSEYLNYSVSHNYDFISSIYYAYSDVKDSLADLKKAAANVEWSERDAEGMAQYWNTIENAERLISESGYNNSVRTYLGSLSPLTEFFADLCGLYTPEFFA